MTTETLRTLLAWSSAINLGVLVLSTVALVFLAKPVSRVHAKLFGLEEDAVRLEYFRYLANYKIAVLVFNIAPYLALRILG